MARYIDIECNEVAEALPRCAFKSRRDIQDFLDNIPTVDVAEVRHGHWKHNIDGRWECSNCGAHENLHTAILGRYCWCCGARLDLEE